MTSKRWINYAARRRLSRLIDSAKEPEGASQSPGSFDPTADGPPAIIMPGATAPDGGPSGTGEGITIFGYRTGIVVPKGGHTRLKRLRVSGADTAVHNEGQFHDEDSHYD